MLAHTRRSRLIAFITRNDEIGTVVVFILKRNSYLFLINHSVVAVVNQIRQLRQWMKRGKL
jgi:hypothetical protein